MLESLAHWIEGSGGLVYILAPLLTLAVAILPIPAEIPALLNGMVFGPVWGTVVTWLFALAGAQISFELARRFGRPLGSRLVPAGVLQRADHAVQSAGWPVLLTLRFLPTVAFTAVNWAAGLTMVPRRTFVWTTALGILPGAVAFTLTGTGLGTLLRGDPVPRLGIWSWVAVGMLMLALTAWLWRRWGRSDTDTSSR
ncbi:MAG TPA: VTT domain-containing protein [Acidobacteriota bacterium]|nr:VTT domain-containing protein [Acidobacteriota bacterium]